MLTSYWKELDSTTRQFQLMNFCLQVCQILQTILTLQEGHLLSIEESITDLKVWHLYITYLSSKPYWDQC